VAQVEVATSTHALTVLQAEASTASSMLSSGF
jgi:hypothetical protein